MNINIYWFKLGYSITHINDLSENHNTYDDNNLIKDPFVQQSVVVHIKTINWWNNGIHTNRYN